MRCPLKFNGITQKFKNTGINKHYGIDLGWHYDKHEPVYAIDDGVVIYNQYQTTGGYVIHIRHDNGYVSEYGHLQKNSQKVKVGSKVKKGQQIANMGSTGIKVTGCHLHLGIYKGTSINYSKKSNFVNPVEYLNIYDGQEEGKNTKEHINHTKKASGIPSEPLLVHNAPNYNKNSVVNGYGIYNGQEVEFYGTTNNMAIIDNARKYYTSNKYLK